MEFLSVGNANVIQKKNCYSITRKIKSDKKSDLLEEESMIVPYLEVGKLIISKNGKFEIRETEEGYELWDVVSNRCINENRSINNLREDIGKIIKIVNK